MDFPSYGVLLQSMKNAIRDEAIKVPRFVETKQGAIRLLVCPFSQEAYAWLGASGEFDPDDIPDIEDSFAILPGGSRVAIFNEDGTITQVDTSSMTSMKISWISRAQELIEPIEGDVKGLENSIHNLGMLSMSKDEIDTMLKRFEQVASILQELKGLEGENGFALWRGAICCKVYFEGELFAYFYASVSGAKQDEDLACAMSAVEVIKTFFSSESRFTVVTPTFEAET